MVQSTIQEPPAATVAPPAPAPAVPWTLRLFVREHPWWSTAIGIVLLSSAIVVWADTRPGFDPYGWLVWGHQTLTGSLDTNAAPSWKPLPYLFTVPFALAGHYQVRLWMIASLAVSLGGVVFAGRIAYRLVAAPPERRWPALLAAAFAGLGILGLTDGTDGYWHYLLSAQSDPMIVALCLGAIDCHLSGRPRWAFALGTLAALGRPEVWPFLALYAIWGWRAVPSMRRLIAAGVVVLLVLWFGIPALTSRSPFVAGSNALGSGRALHNDKVFGTVKRFLHLHAVVIDVIALATVAVALWRRERTILALAAGVVAWIVIEIAFALHGWPGLARYMFEAGAVTVVLAAVGVGRLLAQPPAASRVAVWGGIALVLAICASLVPTAASRARSERKDLRAQRARTAEINRLASTVTGLGGAALLRSCGEPLTRLEYQTILAWQLRTNVSRVGFKYSEAIARGQPIVLFTPTHLGWKVQALHQRLPACRRLPR
jgi:arginine exporter protein ArgO